MTPTPPESKEAAVTTADRELADKLVRVINASLKRVIPNDLPNISFEADCAKTFAKGIAAHCAAREESLRRSDLEAIEYWKDMWNRQTANRDSLMRVRDDLIARATASESEVAGLRALLVKVREDINWMLNNRQFLDWSVFDYLDK